MRSAVAWKAHSLSPDGKVTPEALDSARRGNGMIVHWRKGAGEIFTAATCEWVMGLTRKDPQVEQVTRNVLDRFIADAAE